MAPRTRPEARTGSTAPLLLFITLLLAATSCDTADDTRRGTSPSVPARADSVASASDCPEPVIPPGIYVTNIRRADIVRVWNEPETQQLSELRVLSDSERDALFEGIADFISGHWTWYQGVADANCFFTAWFTLEHRQKVIFVDAHPHTVLPDGRTILLHGAGEPESAYRLRRDADTFWFELTGYDWVARIVAHTAGTYRTKAGP